MYGVHVDAYTNHKSLQYVFSQNELNLLQRRWLELLKYYELSFLYYYGKENEVADALSHLTIGNVYHVEEAKKDLVKDFHKLAYLGVRLEDFPNDGLWLITIRIVFGGGGEF